MHLVLFNSFNPLNSKMHKNTTNTLSKKAIVLENSI